MAEAWLLVAPQLGCQSTSCWIHWICLNIGAPPVSQCVSAIALQDCMCSCTAACTTWLQDCILLQAAGRPFQGPLSGRLRWVSWCTHTSCKALNRIKRGCSKQEAHSGNPPGGPWKLKTPDLNPCSRSTQRPAMCYLASKDCSFQSCRWRDCQV